MQRRKLGSSGIEASLFSLGTMTFGVQTDQADAFRQMDIAIEAGIDLWDTAEMYPVLPITAETQGDSERFVGRWFAETGRRDEVVLATKHTGRGIGHIRGGEGISSASIPKAIEASLERLQTDVIDLYQLHWPNRGHYMFRQNWTYDPSGQNRNDTRAHMAEVLEALDKEVKRGTIRAVGLSNETAWGAAQWAQLADAGHGPRMATIQNEYSLMCRLFDTDLAEMSANEDIGLLAFSPLATGYLTGKYRNGARPEGSRLARNNDLSGRYTGRAADAVEAYQSVADDHGIDIAHLALAWCAKRPFMASIIFGATTSQQLEALLPGMEMDLPDEVMRAVDKAHRAHPMPY